MTNYLIRRGFQMIMVVILATMAIYLLLNAIPGGPLSGINLGADQRARFSAEEIARMEAALGFNKPIWLAYLNWVAGEDWLNEVGDSLGNPDLNGKLVVTWRKFSTILPTSSASVSRSCGRFACIPRTAASRDLCCSRCPRSWRLRCRWPIRST